MELLLRINIYEIIIVAIAVSFIVEGIGYVFRTVKRRVLLPAVSLGITVLRIENTTKAKENEPFE